jgi:hypothetical protein
MSQAMVVRKMITMASAANRRIGGAMKRARSVGGDVSWNTLAPNNIIAAE